MKISELEAADLAGHLLGPGQYICRRFGAGRFSKVFLVTDKDQGQEYVLRIAPPDDVLQLFYEYRMMRQEPAIHERVLAETDVPAPPILAHDFSREKVDRDFLLMPRLPGTPMNQARLSDAAQERALRQWGRYVRQIHELTDPQNRFGYLGEHGCMEPQPTWREAFALMYRKLLDDIVRCGVYEEQNANESMALLDEYLHVFDSCTTPRLCHGDLWVTNLLVDADGTVTGVLDFDRACWGDVEWDLAIAEYCGVTTRPFWEGYGQKIDRHHDDAALRRFFYLLYEHQKYIVISMSSRRNDPKGAQRYAEESLAALDRFNDTGEPEFQ